MGRMSASGRATRGVGWEAQRASQQGQKMEMKTDAPCPEPFRPRGLRTQQSSSCPLGTVFGKPGFGDHRSMLQVRQLGPPPVLWLVTCNKEYAMNQWQWCLFGWNVLAIQFLSFFKRDTMIELSLCVAGCRPRTNLGKFNRAWWTSNVTAGAMAGAHEIFFGRQLFSWKNQLLNIVAGARAGECVVWKCALQVAFLNWTCLSGSKHEKGSRLQGWLLMVSWPNHSGIIHQSGHAWIVFALSIRDHLFPPLSKSCCRHMDATKFDEVGPKKSNPPHCEWRLTYDNWYWSSPFKHGVSNTGEVRFGTG